MPGLAFKLWSCAEQVTMHCTYVLHLGALLKSLVATSLFSNHHHNHDVNHPTVSMITVLTHTHAHTHTGTHSHKHPKLCMYVDAGKQLHTNTPTHTYIFIVMLRSLFFFLISFFYFLARSVTTYIVMRGCTVIANDCTHGVEIQRNTYSSNVGTNQVFGF